MTAPLLLAAFLASAVPARAGVSVSAEAGESSLVPRVGNLGVTPLTSAVNPLTLNASLSPISAVPSFAAVNAAAVMSAANALPVLPASAIAAATPLSQAKAPGLVPTAKNAVPRTHSAANEIDPSDPSKSASDGAAMFDGAAASRKSGSILGFFGSGLRSLFGGNSEPEADWSKVSVGDKVTFTHRGGPVEGIYAGKDSEGAKFAVQRKGIWIQWDASPKRVRGLASQGPASAAELALAKTQSKIDWDAAKAKDAQLAAYQRFLARDHWKDVAATFGDELTKVRALGSKEAVTAYVQKTGDEVIERIKAKFGTENIGFHYNLHGGHRDGYVEGNGIRATMGDIALNYSMNADRNYKVYFFQSAKHRLYDVLNERNPNIYSSRMGFVLNLFRRDSKTLTEGLKTGAVARPSDISIDFDTDKLRGIPYSDFLIPPLDVFYGVAKKAGQGRLSRDEETLAVMRYIEAAALDGEDWIGGGEKKQNAAVDPMSVELSLARETGPDGLVSVPYGRQDWVLKVAPEAYAEFTAAVKAHRAAVRASSPDAETLAWPVAAAYSKALAAAGVKVLPVPLAHQDGVSSPSILILPDAKGHRLNRLAARLATGGTKLAFSPRVTASMAAAQFGLQPEGPVLFLPNLDLDWPGETLRHEVRHYGFFKNLFFGRISLLHGYFKTAEGRKTVDDARIYGEGLGFEELATYTHQVRGMIKILESDPSPSALKELGGQLFGLREVARITRSLVAETQAELDAGIARLSVAPLSDFSVFLVADTSRGKLSFGGHRAEGADEAALRDAFTRRLETLRALLDELEPAAAALDAQLDGKPDAAALKPRANALLAAITAAEASWR